jgi:hypothetical protein
VCTEEYFGDRCAELKPTRPTTIKTTTTPSAQPTTTAVTTVGEGVEEGSSNGGDDDDDPKWLIALYIIIGLLGFIVLVILLRAYYGCITPASRQQSEPRPVILSPAPYTVENTSYAPTGGRSPAPQPQQQRIYRDPQESAA